MDVQIYKGAPIGVNEFSYDIAQEMKADGLNIVRTTMFWMVDNDGNLHELPWVKAYMISQIQNAHKRGLKIFLSIRPQYGGFTSPRGIPESVRATFFLQFNQRVLEWASICEKYSVELFAPIQECEVLADFQWDDENGQNAELMGDEDISEWLQEILPQIKDRYHGEIACGGGAWGGATPEA